MGSRYLEVILAGSDSPGDSSPTELKSAIHRLVLELKYRLALGTPESRDFVCAAVRAVSRLKGSAQLEGRMLCLSHASFFLFANGFDEEALEASRGLDMLTSQAGDISWTRKAETISGIVHSHRGNIAESLIRFSRALALARQLDDPGAEIAVLVNLGTALNYSGLYREAIPCLHRAAVLACDDLGTKAYLPQALCNLAQSHFHLGEHALGLAAISRSLSASLEPSDALGALSRTAREFTMVQLAMEAGETRLLSTHAANCRRYASLARSLRADFMAKVADGLCKIKLGDASQGLANLEGCLAGSGPEGTPERMEALIALAKAYDDFGQPEQGLKCVQQLVDGIAASRRASISALLSLNGDVEGPGLLTEESSDLAALRQRESQLKVQVAEKRAVESQLEMLARLAVAADLREEPSGEHGYRVGKLSALLAAEIEWSVRNCENLEVAARLHDIGKLAVPDRILLTSEELKRAERQFVSAHSEIGAELLARSGLPVLHLAEKIARHHHEWWDGGGYPSGLRGKSIPVEARIVALADVFDALTHGRPFAAPWPPAQAIEYMKCKRGVQFDPDLLDRFVPLVARLLRDHEDLDAYLGEAGRNSSFLQARNRIRRLIAGERAKEAQEEEADVAARVRSDALKV